MQSLRLALLLAIVVTAVQSAAGLRHPFGVPRSSGGLKSTTTTARAGKAALKSPLKMTLLEENKKGATTSSSSRIKATTKPVYTFPSCDSEQDHATKHLLGPLYAKTHMLRVQNKNVQWNNVSIVESTIL